MVTTGADVDPGTLVLVVSSWTADVCCPLAQMCCPQAHVALPSYCRKGPARRPALVLPSKWDPVYSSVPDKSPIKAGACLSGLSLCSQHLGQDLGHSRG